MKNQSSRPSFKNIPQRQSESNRRIGLGFALFALFVFVSFIVRQWLVSR